MHIALVTGRRRLALPTVVFVWLAGWVGHAAAVEPIDFTLALSWQPAFCAIAETRPECRTQDKARWDASHFALHGLWPNVDRDGNGRIDGNDNYCMSETARTRAINQSWRALPPVELSRNTRRALDRVMPGTASHLERHQWAKHGTCSGWDAERYFQVAVARTEDLADLSFTAFVRAHLDDVVSRRALLAAFEADFGKGSARALRLVCKRDGNDAYLSEIRLQLRTEHIAEPLGRASLALSTRVQSTSCPTRFTIESATSDFR